MGGWFSAWLVGNLVVDREVVTRNFPDGLGEVDALAIYEVKAGRIVSARFKFGERKMGCQDNAR